MKTSRAFTKYHFLRLFSGLMVPAALQTCTPTSQAVITYEQVGACQQLSGLVGLGQNNLAFVAFHITGIDNSQTSKDFNFKPTKLYLNTGSLYSAYQPIATPQYCTALGIKPIKSRLVSIGSNQNNLSEYAIFLVESQDPDGEKEGTNTSYYLLYKTDVNDPGVLLAKSNSTITSWPYTKDCSQINYPK
jgi:hypothetical protein